MTDTSTTTNQLKGFVVQYPPSDIRYACPGAAHAEGPGRTTLMQNMLRKWQSTHVKARVMVQQCAKIEVPSDTDA